MKTNVWNFSTGFAIDQLFGRWSRQQSRRGDKGKALITNVALRRRRFYMQTCITILTGWFGQKATMEIRRGEWRLHDFLSNSVICSHNWPFPRKFRSPLQLGISLRVDWFMLREKKKQTNRNNKCVCIQIRTQKRMQFKAKDVEMRCSTCVDGRQKCAIVLGLIFRTRESHSTENSHVTNGTFLCLTSRCDGLLILSALRCYVGKFFTHCILRG